MVTTNQIPAVNSQQIKRRESKHNTTENYQFTKEGSRRGRKEKGNYKQLEKSKMALVRPYLPTITLNVLD